MQSMGYLHLLLQSRYSHFLLLACHLPVTWACATFFSHDPTACYTALHHVMLQSWQLPCYQLPCCHPPYRTSACHSTAGFDGLSCVVQLAKQQLETALRSAQRESMLITDSDLAEVHYKLGRICWTMGGNQLTDPTQARAHFVAATQHESEVQVCSCMLFVSVLV